MLTLKILRVQNATHGGSQQLSGDELSIGRAPENDLVLGDPRISRCHARIVRGAQGYALADCGSTTGSFVNGERVAGERVLRAGDRIRLGDSEILVATVPCACGGPLQPEARFCPSCGARLAPSADGQAAPAVVPKTILQISTGAPAPTPATQAPGAAPAPTARAPGARAIWPFVAGIVLLIGVGAGALVWWRLRTADRPAASPPASTTTAAASQPSTTATRPVLPGPAATDDVVSGKVSLPTNVEASGLRVLAPTDESPLDAGGAFRVRARAVEGQPTFLALATAAGRPLLFGEAGPEISARSTALGLVLLDPEVARRGEAGRAAIRRRALSDPRLAELTRQVERAVTADPLDPLGGDDSDPLYQAAAEITRDALAATESAPGHALHAADRPTDLAGGFVELDAVGEAPAAPFRLEDDPGHKTDAVVLVNGTFSHYRVSVERDGAPAAELQRVLLGRNKPYTFLRAAWPPVGRFETRRTLAVGDGELTFRLQQDPELTTFDIFFTFVAALLGTSGLPGLNAEEDIRLLMASSGQVAAAGRDFTILVEKAKGMTGVAEVTKELAAFFAVRGTALCLAIAPLYARTFKEQYIKVLGTMVAKKAIFALTTGYYAADMAAATWSLARDPKEHVFRSEQRFGVLPPIELTVKTREKQAGEGGGRLFAVAAQLGQVPDDLPRLELRFSYPGEDGEDKQVVEPKVSAIAAVTHRFVKATEAVVTAHAPDGRVVAKGAAALATSTAMVFEYQRPGIRGVGRITITGDRVEGRQSGDHQAGTHSAEQRLEGRYDESSGRVSGSIQGADTFRAMGRVFKTAWEGSFEGQLKDDTLTIRWTGKITKAGGPFSAGLPMRGMAVARRASP